MYLTLSAEIVDVLAGGDLIIVRHGEVETPRLLKEGDLVVQHLSDLDGVGAEDLDPGGLLLQLGLDCGVSDGGGGVGHRQPPVHSLIPDYGLDAFLKQTS